MFIIWQSGQDLARADAGYRECGNCGAECSSTMIVRYSYTNFYFVLGVVTGYEYFLACDDCDACLQLPKAEAKAIAPHVPIPFMRRFGCLSLVGVLLGLWLIAKLPSMMKW